MGSNRLTIAVAALLVVGGVAAWKFAARQAEDTQDAPDSVALPKVDKTAVDSLEITVPGSPTVELRKQESGWRMVQPLASAVDAAVIDAALSKLTELEVVGVAATRKENHDRLDVGAAAGVRVVAKQGDKALCDLLIGKYASGHTMVREATGEKVAMVAGSIRYAFAKDVKDWRDHSMLSFDAAAAQEVSFASDKGAFTFARDAETWKQLSVPRQPSIPEFDGGKVQSLVAMLSGLRATDFADATVTAEQAGLTPIAAATVTVTLGGEGDPQQLVVRIGAADGDRRYAQAAGNEVIYKLASYQSDRLMPDAVAFKKAPAPEPSDAPPAGMPEVQGLPPGMQLPPDVMQQIQQQMQQQAGGH